MLRLVVVEEFSGYKRGDIITDPTLINSIRAGEYARNVVIVSDTAVTPPVQPPPPVAPDYASLAAAVNGLAQQVQTQGLVVADADTRLEALEGRLGWPA